MVLPRFFEVDNLRDFLEYCSYVKVVLYQEEETEKGYIYYRLLAGRLYWEGPVEINSKLFSDLSDLLAAKGIKVVKALDLDTLASRFG